MPSDTRVFLRQLLKKPVQVMALAPSSERLAAEMAAQVPHGPGPVAELGPGTGKITAALLAEGIDETDLILFERDPDFVQHLRKRHRHTDIRCESAEKVGELPVNSLRAVVSGLPLLSMPEPVQRRIVEGAFRALRPGGVFVQFTYGPRPPMREALSSELCLTWRKSPKIWGNLPPARVYTFAQPVH